MKRHSQLLGVPKLASGTGRAQATAGAALVNEWDLLEKISAFSFDTTNSNTGRSNGTCVNLELMLEWEFLHLPCRHHILELTLAAVFFSSMGPSSGPEILIFKRFQKFWKDADCENVVTLKDKPDVRISIISCVSMQLIYKK